MEIVTIFAEHLYAFRYDVEELDEFERLFDCWNDVQFLENFFEENRMDLESDFWRIFSVEQAVRYTREEARQFETYMMELAEHCEQGEMPDLDCLFKPLDNLSSGVVELSKSKAYGTQEPSWLRMYAIKLDKNVYIITGGAIKLTHRMNERDHLKEELTKLDQCKSWLKEQGIYDGEGVTYSE